MANSSNKKTATANKPVEELRPGTNKAAIWQNESKNGTRYSVRVTRLYKEEDEWKTSGSFGRDELPLVAKVAAWPHLGYKQIGDSYFMRPDYIMGPLSKIRLLRCETNSTYRVFTPILTSTKHSVHRYPFVTEGLRFEKFVFWSRRWNCSKSPHRIGVYATYAVNRTAVPEWVNFYFRLPDVA